ncbi:MAG: Mrp/NBP35 family ATP-binding protein [Erysipelotrichaceae bacterium]|nr:Mrp/NBP35 family ATP-binding protein [Erysipelotrichaceae bacterium]
MSNCNHCPSKGKCGKKEDTCGIVNNPNNKIKYVIGVMSGKGGVGKSTVTVLLAKQLQKVGYHVGIMDADITGPSIPRLLSMEKEKAYGEEGNIEPILDKDGIKVMSLNFLIEEEEQPVVWRGPIIANAVKQFWTDVNWGELDVLLIDMPPGTGDVALTVMQSLPVNGVIMVTTPQPMVSMIVAKAVNMCKQLKTDIIGVVENMSFIECPDCGKIIEMYKNSDTTQFLDEHGLSLLCKLPMTQPFATIHRDDDFDIQLQEKIDALLEPAITKVKEVIEKK